MINNFIKIGEEYSIQVIITDKNGVTDSDVNAKATDLFKQLINASVKQEAQK